MSPLMPGPLVAEGGTGPSTDEVRVSQGPCSHSAPLTTATERGNHRHTSTQTPAHVPSLSLRFVGLFARLQTSVTQSYGVSRFPVLWLKWHN